MDLCPIRAEMETQPIVFALLTGGLAAESRAKFANQFNCFARENSSLEFLPFLARPPSRSSTARLRKQPKLGTTFVAR